MGLMDKLKGAVKAVTGGAAKVTLEYPQQALFPGDSLSVRVTAVSTGADVKSNGIFIDVRGSERVKVDKRETQGLERDLSVSRDSFSQSFQICGEFVLAANESRTFEGQVTIPPNVQPTFAGAFTQHQWEVRGRLDARGNDPDSGFLPFRVGLRG